MTPATTLRQNIVKMQAELREKRNRIKRDFNEKMALLDEMEKKVGKMQAELEAFEVQP